MVTCGGRNTFTTARNMEKEYKQCTNPECMHKADKEASRCPQCGEDLCEDTRNRYEI